MNAIGVHYTSIVFFCRRNQIVKAINGASARDHCDRVPGVFLCPEFRMTIRKMQHTTQQLNERTKQMDFEDFKKNLKEDLKYELADKGIENVKIRVQESEKLNQKYEALEITQADSIIGVSLNLNDAFSKYEGGTSYGGILDHMSDSIVEGFGAGPGFDVNSITDYDQMKEKLSMEVVSAERNAELLAHVPHEEMEDMAVVYRLVVDKNPERNGTVLVTDALMEQFGVTHEQLKNDAMQNAPEIRPSEIKGMSEVLHEMMPDAVEVEENEEMFVATVPDKIHGAGVIAYPNFMEDAAKKLGGDFFVLPSSIHEVLLVKDNGEMSAKELGDLVKNVNSSEVAPEERLTDNVYHYDSKEHIFEMADKFEARIKDRESDDRDDKASLLEDLKEKKAEIKEQGKGRKEKEAVKKTRGGEAL